LTAAAPGPKVRGYRSFHGKRGPLVTGILWVVLAVVLAVWLAGLLLRVAGNAVHLLLVVALAVPIYNVVTGRRAP
jgi:hypothetical protein